VPNFESPLNRTSAQVNDYQYDLVVIGSGPAGQKGAIAAAKAGKKVALVEGRRNHLGGVSLHEGTIPSKTLREAIVHLTGYRHQDVFELGTAEKRKIRMCELKRKLTSVIDNELRVIADQLGRNGVDVIEGFASFLSPRDILVEQDATTLHLEAEFALIATGSQPVRPPHIPFDGNKIFDSNQLLALEEIPRSMIVIGGGVVGIEYAMMFSLLGVPITLVDKRSELLSFCDREVVESLMFAARRNGVTFRLGESVERVQIRPDRGVVIELESKKRLFAETALFSGGRESNVSRLNLEEIGVPTGTRGAILVDAEFRTSVKNIFAVGDVIGHPALASTAMEQGRRAVLTMFNDSIAMPAHLPFGIYTVPEISMIGPTERQLTQDCVAYEVGIAHFSEVCRGQIGGGELGFLKILFEPESRKILAIHCTGESATELIHIGQAVMHYGGTIDYFANNVFNYPTMAECYKNAALDGLNKINACPTDKPSISSNQRLSPQEALAVVDAKNRAGASQASSAS